MRLLCLLVLGTTVIAQGDVPKLSELLQAKARIVQLERQNATLQVEASMCRAQYAVLADQRAEQQQQQVKAQLEKEAGCVLDWTLAQPVCKGKP
jgi:hypothetical protein